MDYRTIELSVADHVAVIRLNRPAEGNAITVELATELLDAVAHCEDSNEVRAVVLTGNGKMFSVGGDIRAFSQQGTHVGRYVKAVTHALHAAISRLNWMDAPVIGAINGTAAGGGFSLALGTDIAVAARSARFTMAYTRSGLSPDGSASYFLARMIGMRRAKELALLNPILSADEALQWGIVNRVVADAELMTTAMELATMLARGPREAQGECKRLILTGSEESLESQMEHETRSIAKMATHADGREGIEAFLAKRSPRFRGVDA